MFKKIFSLLCCLLFTFCLFACEEGNSGGQVGGEQEEEDSAVYDYTVEKLEVEAEQSFAPCSFFNFIYGNKHARNYYVDSLTISFGQIMWQSVKIDGKEWGDYLLEKLPEGRYEIEIQAQIPYSDVQRKTFIADVNVSAKNKDITGGIDYLAETLTLTERYVGEQAYLQDFLSGNFHYRAYLWYALNSAIYGNVWEYVLVDCIEWSTFDMFTSELPVGTYDIKIKVSDEFVIRKHEGDKIIEIPYPRTFTIPVQVREKA
ncbi:MAG: hypothetical protein E7360_00130 [Clostridiales bacterium]|nr:hypothetical protein [Clostridiales bacterium]